MEEIRAMAREVRSVWRSQARGDHTRVGAVRVRVLHPAPPDWERRKVRNDDSLVIALEYRDVRVLLPGDIGSATERELEPALKTFEGRTHDGSPTVPATARPQILTILKVAHHGSAGSSSETFLAGLRPSLAVVSAGEHNRFGHPAAAALARYRAQRIPVLRTDHIGAIAVITDGCRAAAYSWSTKEWRRAWMAGNDTADCR
jgi:competence protein ComEC